MTKSILAIVLLAVILTLSACAYSYSYLNPQAEITQIHIVHVSISDGEVIQDKLLQISDISGFLADFESMPCYDWKGDPRPLYPNDEEADAIKLIYSDGSYELINYYGRATCTAEQQLNFYDGSSRFDEDVFRTFIARYLSGIEN